MSVNSNIMIGENKIFVAKGGLRIGGNGKIKPAAIIMSIMNKSEKRKLRKFLHKEGRLDLVRQSLVEFVEE